MKNVIVFSFIFFIISFVWNNSFVRTQTTDELKNFRDVKYYKFSEGNYYDVIKYGFDITPTRNVGKFDYYVFSDKGVYTLVMNRTEYDLWQSYYYDKWLDDPTHDLHKYINYLNTDNHKFMCKSLTAACQSSVQFSDRELYIVNVKNPTFQTSTYDFKDNFIKYKDDPTAAKLIYDPVNPPATSSKQSSTSESKTSSKVQENTTISTSSSSTQSTSAPIENNQNATNTTEGINGNGINNNNNSNNNNNNNDINGMNNNPGINGDEINKKIGDDDNDNSNWWWWLIGGIILLLVLLAALVYALMNRNKKGELREANELRDNDSMSQNNYSGSETEAKVIAYNPHHAVKRVAYNYRADDVTFERDNIVEITKRYNDGWANAINPKDGKECIVPLIILEGDLSEDLSNIPYEEKSSKNIMATPESLYENEFISRKDYEEMKRNDEWIKKVKLMKHAKPESTHNMIIGDNDQFKYISHPIQESNVENIIDPEQAKIGNNRKSMIATVVNSNTDLLNADHILEVCEEEDFDDYEPEEGEIGKEDL